MDRTKVSIEVIHAGIMLQGHYANSMDIPLKQRWCNSVGLEIGDGAPEIMKIVVVREEFGREYTAYRD